MVTDQILLRNVKESDLPVFYEHQLDEEAIRMVAFTPRDEVAFAQHWQKILADETLKIQTIVYAGQTAGYVLAFNRTGEREIGYWIGKRYWGKGIATQAVSEFLRYETARPLSAKVAKHNLASIRVLQKCGFTILGEEREFARRGDQVIPGVVMSLG